MSGTPTSGKELLLRAFLNSFISSLKVPTPYSTHSKCVYCFNLHV